MRKTTSNSLWPFARALAAGALVAALVGTGHAESLEEQTRRPHGTSSLDDDSEQLKGPADDAGSDSLDDDSMDERGRTPDQDGTNSLDNGSLDNGNRPGDE